MAAHRETDDRGFTAALERRRTPASSDARHAEAHTHRHAAGPRKGELHTEAAADAGASQEETTAVADAPVAPETATTTDAPALAPPAHGACGNPQAAETAEAASPPQPIAGLVPARLDGNGGVAPIIPMTDAQLKVSAATPAPVTLVTPTPTPTPAPAASAVPVAPAPSTPAVTTPAAGVATPAPVVASVATAVAQSDPTATADAAISVPAPPVGPAPGGSTTAPAATLTLTIGTASSGTTGGGLEQDAQPQVPAGPAATPAPAADKAAAATMRPQVQDPAPAAATSPSAPAGSIAPAPAQPLTHADPLAGIVRSGGGLTTPHELARELGTRVHMAVREGGRELVLNLRPADLGHLTIRVTMNDGIMQAQIIADRPEAARMLQQSMAHLDSALGDLGYSLDNLDVAYQGQDPRDAQASSQSAGGTLTGEVLEADGTPAVSGTTASSATGSPARLDILA